MNPRFLTMNLTDFTNMSIKLFEVIKKTQLNHKSTNRECSWFSFLSFAICQPLNPIQSLI